MSRHLWTYVGVGPLQEDEARLLDELEDLLEDRPVPFDLQETDHGILCWDRTLEHPEITLMASPFGQEYRGSVTPDDLEDENLQEILQRLGGEHGF